MSATLSIPMPKRKTESKPATGKGRIELQAPQSMIDRLERVAESIGLSVSAFVRMAITDEMDRREGKANQPPKDKQ